MVRCWRPRRRFTSPPIACLPTTPPASPSIRETPACGRTPTLSKRLQSSSTATADSSRHKECHPSQYQRFWSEQKKCRHKRSKRKESLQKKPGQKKELQPKKSAEERRAKALWCPHQAPSPSPPQSSLTPIPNAESTTKVGSWPVVPTLPPPLKRSMPTSYLAVKPRTINRLQGLVNLTA